MIPSSVASIESCAFEYCSKLEVAAISEGVTSIGNYAFRECSNLKTAPIPTSVNSIGDGAFEGCGKLTSVEIPYGVTRIGYWTFARCYELSEVDIPESVTSIDVGAFYGCWGLSSIKLPSGITNIELSSFQACKNLKTVSIPEGVTSIGGGAFINCTGLESVTIPSSVTSIENSAFNGCTSLTDVYYTGKQTQWNSISIGTNNAPLVNATIHYQEPITYAITYNANGGTDAPNAQSKTPGVALTLTTARPKYEDCLFLGWAESADATTAAYQPGGSFTKDADTTLYAVWLKPDFVLPAALTEIGEEAFAGGAFTYVKLPENTDTIGKNAFANCPNLKYIYIPKDCLWIDRYAFTGVNGLTILGVDGSYAQTYASGKGFDFIAVS